MVARERVLIDVEGETKRYAAALSKIPGITDKEAQKASKAFVKRIRDGQVQAALEAERGAKKATSAWEKAAKAAGTAFVVDKIVDAGVALFEFTDDLQQARGELARLSDVSGIATDNLAGIGVAVERVGGDADAAQDAFRDFGERLFDAAQGGGEAEEAFRLLGFSQKELLSRQDDLNGVFTESLQRFAAMEAGAEKTAVGQQLMSDASLDVAAALDAMDLDEAIELAGRWGRTVDDEAAEGARNWSAALADLKGELTGAAVEAGGLFDAVTGIDAITLAFTLTRDVVGQIVDEVGGLASRLASLGLASLTGDLEDVAAAFADVGTGGVEAFQNVGQAVLQNAPEATRVFNAWTEAAFGVQLASEDATDALEDQPPAIDDINLALGRLAQQTAREAEARKAAAAEAKKAAKEQERALKEQMRLELERAKAVNEFAQLERSLTERRLDANAELLAIQEGSNRALLDDEGEILAAFDDRQGAIRELARLTGDLGLVQDATAASQAQLSRELADLEEERAAEVRKTLNTVRDVEGEIDSLREDLHVQQLERFEEAASAGVQLFTDLTSAAVAFQALQLNNLLELQASRAADIELQLSEREQLEEAITDSNSRLFQLDQEINEARLKEQLAAIDEAVAAQGQATELQLLEREKLLGELAALEDVATTAELERQAAALDASLAADAHALALTNAELTKAFNARKALEISGAVVSGAAAAAAALAPPPIGAGPVAGPFLLAGITASTAAQVATIGAQQAPQFPVGFSGFSSAGETMPANLEPFEAVTNRRVTEDLGGAAEVDRLNQGGALPAQGAQDFPSIDPNMLSRAIGRLVADEMGRGRELTREMGRRNGSALPPTGKRTVYAWRR